MRSRLLPVFVGVVLVLMSSTAHAQRRSARRFEPTDLDLKGGAGAVEIDLQGGIVKGDTGRRIIAPDVEATLGLSQFAQLEVDGTLGFDQSLGPRFHFLENTWTSLKLGIFDDIDSKTKASWATGVQIGPKLPTSVGSRGMGVEGIAIVGRNVGRMHLFTQGGFLLDPYATDPVLPRVRPFGIEGGFDLDYDLDAKNIWSLKAELGGTHLFAPKSNEAHLTGGIAWQIRTWLEISLIAIGGFGAGDHYGVLFGASPQFDLF